MSTPKKDNCKTVAIYLAVIAVALLITSFLIPPTGVIDDSALVGASICFGFATLFFAWHAVDKGLDAKLTHGSTSIEITNDEQK